MDLHYLSATEAIKKFKDKSLSPVELVEAIIKRAEAINPKINAHNFTFYEKAINDAKKSEQKYFSSIETLPLEGIPLAIKDEEDITGQPNTNGSLILKNHIAKKTMVDVERILPNKELSINKGGIAPIANRKSDWILRQIELIGKKFDFTLNTPINKISEAGINAILYGFAEEFKVKLK